MSSRIFKPDMVQAHSMEWRTIGTPAGAESFAFAPPLSKKPADGDAARVQDLQARIKVLENEIEQRAQAALQKGVQEGEAQARQSMSAALDASVQKLARTIEDLSAVRQRCRHEAEQDVVTLSLAIARRILRRELTIDSDAILGLVRAALDKLDVREIHRVRVDPNHADSVKRHLERIGSPRKLEVLADNSLSKGAVIFETSRGSVDASPETQIAEIERGFADLVRHT
jgi:flagellar assembly protein FliH